MLAVSVLCAAVVTLAPEKGGINKYISFVMSLVIALTLLSPFSGDFSAELDGILDISGKTEETTADESYGKAKFLSDSAVEAYCIATGEKKEEITVRCDTDGKTVTRIEIIAANTDKDRKLSEKLSKIFGTEVIITEKTGENRK